MCTPSNWTDHPVTAMFTTAELVRMVIKRLNISNTLKQQWLIRRAVTSTRPYTNREFRKLRRRCMPLIRACVDEMNTFIDNGGIAQAEADYYNHVGEAPVDMVFNIVSERMFEYDPPEVRRTCTGYFGPSCTEAHVAFKPWE